MQKTTWVFVFLKIFHISVHFYINLKNDTGKYHKHKGNTYMYMCIIHIIIVICLSWQASYRQVVETRLRKNKIIAPENLHCMFVAMNLLTKWLYHFKYEKLPVSFFKVFVQYWSLDMTYEQLRLFCLF